VRTVPSLPAGAVPAPEASVADTARTVQRLLLPLMSRGLIERREPVVAAAQKLDLDRTAIEHLRELRSTYGPGPLRLKLPGRRLALVLEPDHVGRMLAAADEPLAPANLEKRHALSQFQPEGVLASHGAERTDRRRFNEQVLDHVEPLHRDASAFARVAREEAEDLLATVDAAGGRLDWDTFLVTWNRVIRRVVLGDGARDDQELTEKLVSLRQTANRSYLAPTRRRARERFLDHLAEHVARAEPGSLAASMAAAPVTEDTEPVQQVPQWLFAYEPAGMVVMRTLALMGTHPAHAERARAEVAEAGLDEPAELPWLRGCVLDTLRLWPTTPGILRDTTTATRWDDVVLPAGTGVLVFAPFFHRDPEVVEHPDAFDPAPWAEARRASLPPLVPFSDGPAICPGRNVVLLTTATFLATILAERNIELHQPDPSVLVEPLPSVLDMFRIEVDLPRRPAPS
jgi:cytochrome P450